MQAVLKVPLPSPAKARFARSLVVAAHGRGMLAKANGKVLEVTVVGERFADLRAKTTSLFRDLKIILDSMELVKHK